MFFDFIGASFGRTVQRSGPQGTTGGQGIYPSVSGGGSGPGQPAGGLKSLSSRATSWRTESISSRTASWRTRFLSSRTTSWRTESLSSRTASWRTKSLSCWATSWRTESLSSRSSQLEDQVLILQGQPAGGPSPYPQGQQGWKNKSISTWAALCWRTKSLSTWATSWRN